MTFCSGPKYNTNIYYYCTTCATDIHLLIQVQQVGVETDEKPLTPYEIITTLSASGEISNQS